MVPRRGLSASPGWKPGGAGENATIVAATNVLLFSAAWLMATLHGSVKKHEKVRKVKRGSHLTRLDLAQLINMKKEKNLQNQDRHGSGFLVKNLQNQDRHGSLFRLRPLLLLLKL